MTLSEDVNLEEYVMAKDDLSGADIKVRRRYQLKLVHHQEVTSGKNSKMYCGQIPTADSHP